MEIFIIFLLVLSNAFFAIAEIAIISFNDNKLRRLAEEGNRKALLLTEITQEPTRFLATIQTGVTLVGFLASAFAADSFAEPVRNSLLALDIGIGQQSARLLSLALITLPLAYISLVFGELLPKRLALQKPETISFLVATPLRIFSKIAMPFVRLLAGSTDLLLKAFGVDETKFEGDITEEEIRLMMDVGREKGVLHADEREMINNIFEFDNKTAKEVMTHRVDIKGIPLTMPIKEVIGLVTNAKYTRFPVYEETLDDIVGILHIKALMPLLGTAEEQQINLASLLRKPYFVSINKKTDALFKELQKNNTHLAIVVDEYGGVAGLVTIEDLLEEIVGNIRDEYDEDEEAEFESINENCFIFQGDFSLEKARQILHLPATDDDYETIGGLVVGLLGRIPAEDETIIVTSGDWVFEVLEIDERRITKVKVYRVPSDKTAVEITSANKAGDENVD